MAPVIQLSERQDHHQTRSTAPVADSSKQPPRLRIELPDHERGRSPEDILRLEKLRASLSNPRAPLSHEQREARLKQIAELETAPAAHAEATWREATANETAALAEGRGEEVERLGGAVRVTSRDSLLSLLRAGKLTSDQYDAGVVVRDLYERRNEGLGSQMGEIGGGSSPTYDNSATVFYGVQRAKALQQIGSIERAVAVACTDEPACLQLLRWVCDLGHSVRSMSAGGRSFDRNAAALARALDVADAEIRKR